MNKNILIIEDNANLIDLYISALEELDIDVHFSNDGENAFKKIARKDYDLYIVDIFLPTITGLEVIKVIKIRYENAKIVVISAAATDKLEKDAMQLGASALMRKPFRLNELKEIVKRFI